MGLQAFLHLLLLSSDAANIARIDYNRLTFAFYLRLFTLYENEILHTRSKCNAIAR